MKSKHTWIVIADGGRARVLERTGGEHDLSVVEDMTMTAELPRSSSLGSDRLGRSHESVGAVRHAIEPHCDPHDKLKREFLGRLVERLDERFGAAEFDRLGVGAPPTALGQIRMLLTDRLRAAVAGEIAKDLTKTPIADLADHLDEVLRRV